MKQIVQEHAIMMTGNLEEATKRFTINMSGKIAKMLSDSLYSNKILAVMRELSTNAYDSHVENGNEDEPFVVYLPTYFDNTFYIRDFGTGMSPDKILNLYTTYGGSDRETSNDFAGCYGLGSKTPLCYNTKTATVESWYNGVHYTYQVFLDSEHIPCITKLCEQTSNERSGVKITIKTLREDYQSFARCAYELYSTFIVPPSLLGNIIDIKPVEYILRGNGWGMRSDNNYTGARAIMGNIAYKINWPSDIKIDDKLNSILNSKIDMFFDIGSLDVEVSREGLSFDKRTQIHIEQKLKQIYNERLQLIHDKIASSKNLWEARLNFRTILDNFFISRAGDKISDYIRIEDAKYNGVSLYDGYFGRIDLSKIIASSQLDFRRIYKPTYYRSIKTSFDTKVDVRSNLVFVIDDLKRGSHQRCRNMVAEDESKVVYLVGGGHAGILQFCDKMGFDISYMVKASSLSAPIREATTRSARGSKTDVVQFNDQTSEKGAKNIYWMNSSVDINGGGFYVETKIYDFKYDCESYKPHLLSDILECLKKSGVDVSKIKIYGVNSANVHKFEHNKKWQEFAQWAIQQLKVKIATYNPDQLNSDAVTYRKYIYNNPAHSWEKIVDKLDKSHDIVIMYEELKKISSAAHEYQTYQELNRVLKFFGVTSECNSKVNESNLPKMVSDIYKKYSLLRYVLQADTKEIVKYINAIDKL